MLALTLRFVCVKDIESIRDFDSGHDKDDFPKHLKLAAGYNGYLLQCQISRTVYFWFVTLEVAAHGD